MRILILEDEREKLAAIRQQLDIFAPGAEIFEANTFAEYLKRLNREKVDLLIVDLVIPQLSITEEPREMTAQIIEVTRGDYQCPNFRTAGIALTSYDETAEENFRELNTYDFSVITFEKDAEAWKAALERKIRSLPSSSRFDFVIVCALPKESLAFADAGFALGETEIVAGLHCRTIRISGRTGVIVTAPRMGLVSCAVTTTIAIHSFKPQLVCMSGICGGVPGSAQIYDVVIAETCHQHDAGKWAQDVFKPEIYSNSIHHQLAQKFRRKIESPGFIERLKAGILLRKEEFPDGVNNFTANIFLAPASSGSAVIANEKVVEQILGQQRKNAVFEMESYALYEAARLCTEAPIYFSAKTVVDDGGANKGDKFHRVGCILAARATAELISCFEFA